MEQRKLIRLGNSSYAVALPKDWVEKSGLKKGDNVFVERNGHGEMVVSPTSYTNKNDKSVKIEIDGKDSKRIKREFAGAYQNGYSSFFFYGNNAKVDTVSIRKIIESYLSCEVVSESEKEVVVKDFFNFGEFNINIFVKRIDNNIREIFDILIKSSLKREIKRDELSAINDIDLDINKFYFLIARAVNIGLNNPAFLAQIKSSSIDLFLFWWLIFHLEHTGDNLKAIATRFSKEGIPKSANVILSEALKNLQNRYQETLNLFYSSDKVKAYAMIDDGSADLENYSKLGRDKDDLVSYIGLKLEEVHNCSYQILKLISNFEKGNEKTTI
mgnify:CR=1 FL=1